MIEGCEHCIDGHDDPMRRPWATFITDFRDGDGQPMNMIVSKTQGSHIFESDAVWLRHLMRKYGKSAWEDIKDNHPENWDE